MMDDTSFRLPLRHLRLRDPLADQQLPAPSNNSFYMILEAAANHQEHLQQMVFEQ